jgi:hypothetical protein
MENKKEIEIKPNEIFSFNLYIFISIGYFFYITLCLLPQYFFEDYLHIDWLPDKYWLTAVPTHILVTLIAIFYTVKGLELTKTLDCPPFCDCFHKELSLKEMKKEVVFEYEKGILPDTCDLSEKVVKEVLAMDDNEEDE